MYIKMYYGDKPLYLCDELDDMLRELLHHPDVVFIDELSSHAINSMLHEIKKADFHAGILLADKLDDLKNEFFKHLIVIEASGGIVQNHLKELLFIFRRGKWDLPKGKMEEAESPELCAAREIAEETGVTGLTLKHFISDTYHLYDEYGKHFLKLSHWYYFTCEGGQPTQPQTEEDITEVKWFSTKDIRTAMSNTFATIKDVVTTFFDVP